MLNKIFPKINELTVFVTTVVLYVTVIFDLNLVSILIDIINFLWMGWVDDFSDSNSFYTDTKLILGLIFMVFISLSYLIGPLLMPFTEKDIRVFSIIVLWVDVLLIIYWNIKSSESGQWYRVFPIIYGAAWLLYAIIVLRLDRRNGIAMLVSEEQTNPKVALKVASIGVVLSQVFVHLFNMWWLDAYMLALLIAFILNGVFSELNTHNKQSQ